MSKTVQKSPELHRLDNLWHEYISSDPDLRRFYLERRRTPGKRPRKTHTRTYPMTVPVALTNKAADLAGMAASSALFVASLMFMLFCL